jgi:NAD(P)H-dependent flavin oxidoreductase YrpB (nitropropane dioxygenase family)
VVKRARARGIKLASLVGSPEHARRQRGAGVDLIVAQGTEAGGHTGSISTMVLTPQIVDLVAPIPVLAAGGIASGRQMAAAMALGAAGVWCGSVWLCTAQSDAPPEVKRKILAARSQDAVITRAYSGKPSRVLKSGWTEAWAAAGAPDPLQMPLQSLLTKEAMARVTRAGAEALASYPAGQVIGQMQGETTVRQVFNDMLVEFADTMERLNRLTP